MEKAAVNQGNCDLSAHKDSKTPKKRVKSSPDCDSGLGLDHFGISICGLSYTHLPKATNRNPTITITKVGISSSQSAMEPCILHQLSNKLSFVAVRTKAIERSLLPRYRLPFRMGGPELVMFQLWGVSIALPRQP
jgi:hypothetical protein